MSARCLCFDSFVFRLSCHFRAPSSDASARVPHQVRKCTECQAEARSTKNDREQYACRKSFRKYSFSVSPLFPGRHEPECRRPHSRGPTCTDLAHTSHGVHAQYTLLLRSPTHAPLLRIHSGYAEYIKSGPDYDFVTYRTLVHHVTQIFQALSAQVHNPILNPRVRGS